MNGKKYFLSIIFFCCFLMNQIGLCQLHEIPLTKPIAILGSNAENAAPEQSFYWPLAVDSDKSGNVYILDSGNQRIVKFNRNFHFIRELGKQGQGPGEFLFRPGIINTGTMKIYSDKIFVVDNNNRRLQIFSLDGELLNGFHTFSTTGGIGLDLQNRIFLNSSEGDKSGHLILVYDAEGNFQYSFADKIIKRPPRRFLIANESNFCLTSDDHLFFGFVHFPIIRKYDKKGNLVFEKLIDFSSIAAKKMAEKNKYNKIRPKLFQKNPPKELVKIIIKGVQPSANGGCYVLISNRIFLLDTNGKTVKIFVIKNKKMPIFRFAMNENQKRLYALDSVINHRLVIYDLNAK